MKLKEKGKFIFYTTEYNQFINGSLIEVNGGYDYK